MMVKLWGIDRSPLIPTEMQVEQTMNAKLLVVIGKTTKREVSLQLPAVLGRSREADITVAHPLISRRHCEISEDHGLLILRDMTSLNGTMIGGRRVEFAALLPDAEFTIGPLTFRVEYEYDGDLESVPETRFVETVEEPLEAGLGEPIPAEAEEESMREVEEAIPATPASESSSGELAVPDFMAMADADIEEILPAAAAPPAPAPAAAIGTIGPQWPPVADDKLPTLPTPDVLDDPMEVDSSLQSGGGHGATVGKESRWAAEPQSVEKLRDALRASAQAESPADATPGEKVAKPPAKRKPQAANPPKRPTEGDDMDPEFGSFLEGLE